MSDLASLPAAIVIDLRPYGCEAPYGVVEPGKSGYKPIFTKLSLDIMDAVTADEFETRRPTEAERALAAQAAFFGWRG